MIFIQLFWMSTSFKKRYNEHKSSFRNYNQDGGTKLSIHIWDLKGNNVNIDIFNDLSWSIKAQCVPFNPVSNICRLCLTEKYMILFEPVDASLNQRSEFFTTCRHKEAWLLVNQKWIYILHIFTTSFLSYLILFNYYLFHFGTV